jgi:hypothetical protein
MASRPLIIATLIGASVGVPYLASQSKTNKPTAANTPPSSAPHASSQSNNMTTRLPAVAPTMPAVPQLSAPTTFPMRTPPIDGAQFTSVNQIFRFDVTKEWVYQNWSRKSTGPTDVGLYSVRVPLVMSPSMTGLAGSLTYYFNAQNQVEHISFRGRTGDTTPLVQLLTTTYQLEPVGAATGERLYQLQYRGAVQSELRTHPEAILYSTSANQSIVVELELARPGSERVLPPRPTGFVAPQVAGAPADTTPAAITPVKENSSGDSKSGSYFSRIRHATQEEESQVIWKRWPN